MRLSVCCLTGAPAAQVAAVLAPWRAVADEVVLGCDDRVAPEVRTAYEGLADRVVPVTFTFLEAHLAELHAACRGDWAMRVDADEVPSAALLEALPALMADLEVAQWAFPRRWLAPDGAGLLDEQPWFPDWQLRLVRNDAGLRFSGELHTGPEAAGPRALSWTPLLHLDCALQPVDRRRAKALVYDVQRPGMTAPGGKPMIAYYDPERWAQRPIVPVAPEDRPAVQALLAAAGSAIVLGDRATPAAVTQAEGRAEDAEITVLEHDLRWLPGEHRPLTVAVTNRSADPWPAGEGDPPVRLAYRWREADGTEADGFRTPFPRDVAPGATCLAELLVGAPETPGRRELVVDVVHEHVRWFEVGCVVPVEVLPAPEPPTEREVRPVVTKLLRRPAPTPIPKVLHRVWLGGNPLPDAYVAYGESWRRHHPDWELRLWTDEDAPVPALAARARNVAERADLVRYEVLRRHGGVYVDTDVECLRPIDPLLAGVRAFAAYEVPGRLCNAVMGGVAGHEAFAQLLAKAEDTVGRGHYPEATATLFVTRVLEPLDDVTLFSPERFYPFLWDGAGGAREAYGPETYGVHHWAMSWKPDA